MQVLAACIQHSNLGRTNTVHEIWKVLTLTWLKAPHTDSGVPSTLSTFIWQCELIFKFWLTFTPKSFCVWTIGSSVLSTVYASVPCWVRGIIVHFETFISNCQISTIQIISSGHFETLDCHQFLSLSMSWHRLRITISMLLVDREVHSHIWRTTCPRNSTLGYSAKHKLSARRLWVHPYSYLTPNSEFLYPH